ncbi:MAG: hypothetical protein M0R51_07675 [Clostridia bacterium]|jgi:hypothetical protein|nr:hypothetical protein [Clostridia bacterium]
MVNKICENCGKPNSGEYGSGRFCSAKCSRSFSTKDKRKEINEKVKQTFKLTRHVRIDLCDCGKNCDNGKCICSDCSPYRMNKELFNKLNIDTKDLKMANDIAINKLKKMYFDDNMSSCQIYEKYKIKENSLFNFFKKNGINLRDNKKAGVLALLQNRRTLLPNNFKFHSEWHESWDNKKMFLRSSYEKKFAEHLDKLKIVYEVESKRVSYEYDNTIHVYIPDFYIPSLNLIVETKCSYFMNKELEQNTAKLKAVEDLGYKVLLLLDGEINF